MRGGVVNRTVVVLAVYDRKTREIAEYLPLYPESFSSAREMDDRVRIEARRLAQRYPYPESGFGIFEGGARTLEGFFRMFPRLKRTASTREIAPSDNAD